MAGRVSCRSADHPARTAGNAAQGGGEHGAQRYTAGGHGSSPHGRRCRRRRGVTPALATRPAPCTAGCPLNAAFPRAVTRYVGGNSPRRRSWAASVVAPLVVGVHVNPDHALGHTRARVQHTRFAQASPFPDTPSHEGNVLAVGHVTRQRPSRNCQPDSQGCLKFSGTAGHPLRRFALQIALNRSCWCSTVSGTRSIGFGSRFPLGQLK